MPVFAIQSHKTRRLHDKTTIMNKCCDYIALREKISQSNYVKDFHARFAQDAKTQKKAFSSLRLIVFA
jgi:hypothetical protein